MDINEFINKFAAEFFETDREEFNEETKFKELEEWESLTALTILAMVARDYSVKLSGNDIINADTIKDLYNRVVELKK